MENEEKKGRLERKIDCIPVFLKCLQLNPIVTETLLREDIHVQLGLTENAGHEIAGHENTGHEFARHDKYRMKIDHITLECAFLLNFKSFLCKASVITYKKLN